MTNRFWRIFRGLGFTNFAYRTATCWACFAELSGVGFNLGHEACRCIVRLLKSSWSKRRVVMFQYIRRLEFVEAATVLNKLIWSVHCSGLQCLAACAMDFGVPWSPPQRCQGATGLKCKLYSNKRYTETFLLNNRIMDHCI